MEVVKENQLPSSMSRTIHFIRDRLKLRHWIGLCLILAAAIGLPRVLSSRFLSQHRAELSLKRAQAHLAAREFDQARNEFRAALRLQPGNAAARHQLATLELGLGNWELAFLEFQSLTELQPENPNGWIGLADIMVKSGLLETPETALDKAIAAAPKRADAHSLRAAIRFRLGRYHGAHLDAQAAVAEAPKDAASWGLLVRSAARSLGADAGIEAARRGVALVGEDPALLLPSASLLAERGRTRDAGDREAARKQLDALLLKHPADEEALALRAVLDAKGGRVEASLAKVDAALELLPMSRTLRDVHARLQAARNDSAAIAALLAEMVQRDLGPAPAPSSRVRAEAQSARGKLAAVDREARPEIADFEQRLHQGVKFIIRRSVPDRRRPASERRT